MDGGEAARYVRPDRRRPGRRDGEVTVAQQIEIPEVGSTAKIRNIIAVPVLAIVTLGVYIRTRSASPAAASRSTAGSA